MLHREIIAVSTKHIKNTLCDQNVEVLKLKFVVRIETTMEFTRLVSFSSLLLYLIPRILFISE
jgi:hypothetical protein